MGMKIKRLYIDLLRKNKRLVLIVLVWLLSYVLLIACTEEERKEFYSNNKLKSIYVVDNTGKKNGIYKEYYENGNLKRLLNYDNDSLSGLSVDFTEKGKVADSIYYKNGKMNGRCKFFYASGKLKIDSYLYNDKTLWYKYYDTLGNIIEEMDSCSKFNYKYSDPVVNFQGGMKFCSGKWKLLKISFKNKDENKYLRCIYPIVSENGIVKEGENIGEFYIRFLNQSDKENVLIVSVKDTPPSNGRVLLKEISVKVKDCNY